MLEELAERFVQIPARFGTLEIAQPDKDQRLRFVVIPERGKMVRIERAAPLVIEIAPDIERKPVRDRTVERIVADLVPVVQTGLLRVPVGLGVVVGQPDEGSWILPDPLSGD